MQHDEAAAVLVFMQPGSRLPKDNRKMQRWSAVLKNCRMIDFKRMCGDLGSLTAIEGNCDVPFEIRRVYYITGVPQNEVRGFHSHRQLEQILLCLNGSVKIRVKTPDEEEIIPLKEDSRGLYIGHMIWREMFDFTPGAVLMVLASEHYTEADYIRSYDDYLNEASSYFEEEQI